MCKKKLEKQLYKNYKHTMCCIMVRKRYTVK